ncbi:uncharacterized protein B0H18DRAFT_992517 [Fomitopsis serialis]|uniref:uncharacterized protein n=1 Tax=Fomitopsis serialis TaxID=139415 RepID=UPI002008159F|nr:uncharacterized protein B0H18DRAFT_992517 [Neoantrodia serialis]KAH9930615.1 hypothetical protein B0H18DRAFT_992517 [Neoantrodia serialis]
MLNCSQQTPHCRHVRDCVCYESSNITSSIVAVCNTRLAHDDTHGRNQGQCLLNTVVVTPASAARRPCLISLTAHTSVYTGRCIPTIRCLHAKRVIHVAYCPTRRRLHAMCLSRGAKPQRGSQTDHIPRPLRRVGLPSSDAFVTTLFRAHDGRPRLWLWDTYLATQCVGHWYHTYTTIHKRTCRVGGWESADMD